MNELHIRSNCRAREVKVPAVHRENRYRASARCWKAKVKRVVVVALGYIIDAKQLSSSGRNDHCQFTKWMYFLIIIYLPIGDFPYILSYLALHLERMYQVLNEEED